MSKMVMAALMFLVGLFVLVAGVTSMGTLYMTGVSLIIAGILVIISALLLAVKKHEMMGQPTK